MKIDHFLFHYNVTNIKLLNKIISVFCLINIFVITPDLFELFNKNGLINESLNNQFIQSFYPLLSWFTKPLEKISIPYSSAVLLVFTVYVLALFFTLLNFHKLFFSIVAWFLHIMIVNSSYFFSYGADYFISFTLFVNIFLCIDNKNKDEKINALHSFIIRFTQIQLCFVYFFAGFGKILGTDWFDGNALWYISNAFSPAITTLFSFSLIKYSFVLVFFGWTILFFELFYPFLVYNKKFKKITLIAIILMHVGIGFVMQFYTFGLIMIILNVIAWNDQFIGMNLFNLKKPYTKWKLSLIK